MDAFAANLGLDGKQRRGTVYRWEAGLRKPSAPVMKLLEKLAEAQLALALRRFFTRSIGESW